MTTASLPRVVLLLVILAGVHAQMKAPNKKLDIYSLHIRSDIRYRFATTTVESRVANRDSKARQISFHVTLPKAAFLANFSMEIDGKVYPGNVKEKEAAKRQYDRAVSRGQSAGYVGTKARDSNKFDVSVNVGAQKKVKFTLIYQELLKRRLNNYEHLINIDPGQIVRDMLIQVAINESREITSLNVPPIRKNFENSIDHMKGSHETATVNRTSPTSAFIEYRPSVKEQVQASENGLRGQFVVQYDVQRSLDAGEVQVADGYFIHYFAPNNLTPVNKNVLFILDVSGSMSGKKMSQTKEAMLKILSDLRTGDNFNLITFSTRVQYWKDARLVPVNPDNIEEAKRFVRGMRAHGGTNINEAVLRGLQFLKQQDNSGESSLASMLVFLTDGEPTSGETYIPRILENIRKSNKGKYSLYSLGFGFGADFPFLQKLSLQNGGLARKIYEDSDANIQLEGFYKEISTPLLSDIKITYLDEIVDNRTLTQHNFHCYFDGTELIIAGKLNTANISHFRSEIIGKSSSGDLRLMMDVELTPPPFIPRRPTVDRRSEFTKFTERLWAYLTIKELLRKEKESSLETVQDKLRERALHMSLKYFFVTPLTSMVVTKPDQEDGSASNLEDTDKMSHGNDRRLQKVVYHYVSKTMQPAFHSPASVRVSSRARGVGGPYLLHSPTVNLKLPTKTSFDVVTKKKKHQRKGKHTIKTESKPKSSGHYLHMRLKPSSPGGQKIALCMPIRYVNGANYEYLSDNSSGLEMNVKVDTFNGFAYISHIYIMMPNSKDVYLTPHNITVGNTTVPYQRQTISLGNGKKLYMRNTKQIRIRYRSIHSIRISRRQLGSKHRRVMALSINTVKGVQQAPHGIRGDFWRASGNVKRKRGSAFTLSLSFPQRTSVSCPASQSIVEDVNTGSIVTCYIPSCLRQRYRPYYLREIYA